MVRAYKSEEVIGRLRKTIASGKAILQVGASTGITAKCAEIGGADLIGVHHSGWVRVHWGLSSIASSLPLCNANQINYEIAKVVTQVVKDTPVVATLLGEDPTVNWERFLKQCIDIGVSGVKNFPWRSGITMGEQRARQLEEAGMGFEREIEMLKIVKKLDMFAFGYAFSEEETRRLVKDAGVDSIGAHMGVTSGGLTGGKQPMELAEAAKRTQKIADVARAINPDIIVLCHGGPTGSVEEVKYILEHTDVEGFIGASTTERIPIERAITETTRAFKNLSIKKRN